MINIKAEFSIVSINRPPEQYVFYPLGSLLLQKYLTLTINADRPENLDQLSCGELLN